MNLKDLKKMDRDDLLALRRRFRRCSSRLTGGRVSVFTSLCAHAHWRCPRLSSIVHVNGIKLFQDVGHVLALGITADEYRERSPALPQVGVIQAAVVL